ncbi:MAG: DUF6597 domain-containing transcriptional factor [Planctomycetota bacterium]
MEYREQPPRFELTGLVRCFWQVRGPGRPGVPERVVPDGCAEIVLNQAAAFRRFAADGTSHRQDHVLLVGQLGRAITIAPEGAVDLLGIRFEPGGLARLLGAPMDELLDVDVALRHLRPDLHGRLEAAAAAHTFEARTHAIEGVLLDERARSRPRAHAGLVAAAVARLGRADRTVERVAEELGVARRTLERAFRREVGLSPRDFVRVARVQRVVTRLEHGVPAGGWASLAVDAGYFDQSHLIRDFRQIAGTTPGRFLAERNPLNEAFAAAVSHSSNP